MRGAPGRRRLTRPANPQVCCVLDRGLLAEVEKIAERLQITRSRLLAAAVEEGLDAAHARLAGGEDG